MIGSQVGLQLTRALAAIAIARLLTPEEYGLAALALVFASLVMVFSDLALGAALIQRKELSAVDRDTAFWVTVGSGIFFAIVGFALAGPLAALYGDADAKPLLQVLSIGFVVFAVGAPQQSLMLRDMDFARVEILPMIGALAGAAAGVTVAALGGGPWAIIVQYAAGATVTTIAVWLRSSWRPRMAFSMDSLRDLGGFSVFMLGHRMLYYLQTNGDRFLIGRFLGTSALGTYAIAFNTILQPASKIGGPLQRVMSPAFCRIQDEPERIAVAWARVVRILAGVSVAPLAALVVLAPDFVPVVLGDQWHAAIPVIQILAWVGIVQALQSLSIDVLMARDRARTIFRFSIVLVTCHLVAFSVGLNWGVVGVAVSFAISTTLVEPWQTILAARALGVSPMIFLRSISGVFQAAAGMCLVVLGVRVALVDAGVHEAVRLVVCTGVAAVVYVALCAWRVPELAASCAACSGGEDRASGWPAPPPPPSPDPATSPARSSACRSRFASLAG